MNYKFSNSSPPSDESEEGVNENRMDEGVVTLLVK